METAPLLLHPEQETTRISSKKLYHRMRNEPALWFQRFQRYMIMGSERSVQAVLDQEREAQNGTNERREAKKDLTTLSPAAKKNRAQVSTIAIPGSWKQASVKWRWVERAHAFDDDQLQEWQTQIQNLLKYDAEYAHSAYRVYRLGAYVDFLANMVTVQWPDIPLKERLACIKLSQSLMRDIAREMKQIR